MYRQIENQKKIQKILVGLLYKRGYCLCIPDIEFIKPYLEQINPIWIQKFLLTKNELNLMVIPMSMLIFIKNKCLNVDQSKRLLELLYLLIMKADFDTMDQLFVDNKIQELTWPYFFLNELMRFTFADFVKSEENSERIMAMANVIEFFLEKASPFTFSNFCFNTQDTGFNVIQRLLYVIAYENLHAEQVIYLSNITQKIIKKITVSEIKILSFQIYHKGYSLIWYVLEAWMMLVFKRDNLNQIKINCYTKLIHSIVEKIDNEKIASILLENENKGYIIILRYIFFKRMQRNIFHDKLVEAFNFFTLWCKKIFSQLTYHQIKLILKTLPLVLNNNRRLSMSDKYDILNGFFDYFFNYSQLKTQEFVELKDLKDQIKEIFSHGSNNIMLKFFRQMRKNWFSFNRFNFKIDQISLDENSDLLTSDCDKLTANYLSM